MEFGLWTVLYMVPNGSIFQKIKSSLEVLYIYELQPWFKYEIEIDIYNCCVGEIYWKILFNFSDFAKFLSKSMLERVQTAMGDLGFPM